MIILGINAFHGDSAAAIVRDGALVAAAEEERFRRVKHWAGFPSQAIAYCLREAGVTLADVQHVAINQDSRANFLRKLAYVVIAAPGLRRSSSTDSRTGAHARASRICWQRMFPASVSVARCTRSSIILPIFHRPFMCRRSNEAVVVSVDGFGDFSSAAWGVGRGRTISIDGRVYFPHSLGIFYQALTQYLGFPHYGDEYKVMGLAPYGKPAFMDAMRKIVQLKPDGSLRARSRLFSPSQGADIVSVDGRLARIHRSVRARAGDIAGTAPYTGSIRSRTAIATSRARSRRCTRKPSSI